MTTPVVRLESISKSFDQTRALKGVSIQLLPGEIVGLLGENGAGKTTLMNVLYGLVAADSGEIIVRDQHLDIRRHSPAESINLGISMVHQHFMLVNRLTVTENLIIGKEPTRHGILDIGEAARQVGRLARQYELAVEPDDIVGDLSVSQRQRLEILRALYHKSNLLILDEPTSVLAPSEVDSLFSIIQHLRDDGMCLVLIAHKLEEVLRVCGRIYILRQGNLVAETSTKESDHTTLARLMVGDEYRAYARPESGHHQNLTSTPALELKSISVTDAQGTVRVKDVSLAVQPGEIVCIAGVAGNGQAYLEHALIGLTKIGSGKLLIGGKEVTNLSTAERNKAGLGYIPQDRNEYGLVMSFPIRDNLVLGRHRSAEFSRWGVVKRAMIRTAVEREVKKFNIACESTIAPARSLSGGNQQKVVLARAVAGDPKVLLASQVCRGLDVAAVAAIYKFLRELTDQGKGILLFSFDLDEVLELSDRLCVMRNGALIGLMDRSMATRQRIGELMTGAKEEA